MKGKTTPKRLLIALTILLINLLQETNCWTSTGHLVIARLAAIRLSFTEVGTNALNWARSKIRPYSQVCGEANHTFAEASVWKDKLEAQGWNSYQRWSFINQPLYNYTGPRPDISINRDKHNIVWAINQCLSHLKSNQQVQFGSARNILGESLDLRNLISFIGDIHQPLHTTSLYSPFFNDSIGDLNGKKFTVVSTDKKTISSLFKQWESVFNLYPDTETPLSSQSFSLINQTAENIRGRYRYESFAKRMNQSKTPESWAEESFNISRDVVYKGVGLFQPLTQKYVQYGTEIAQQQIAIAGYRLAEMIQEIYNATEGYGLGASSDRNSYRDRMLAAFNGGFED